MWHVYPEHGEMLLIENPSKMPNTGLIERVEEPFVRGRFIRRGRRVNVALS